MGVGSRAATHDFLLSHKLSLAAEYGTWSDVEVRFFSLHREEATLPVDVEQRATLAEIENNSILDEYAAHDDEERRLFHGEGGARPVGQR